MLLSKKFYAALLGAVAVTTASQAQTQEFQNPDPNTWYRIVTDYHGTDARLGRCIQYYPAGSEHDGLIWSADPVKAKDAADDYQSWRFEQSPDDPTRYALICKAAPEGYLSGVPTEYTPQGRWKYVEVAGDDTSDKYLFEFGRFMSGVDQTTGESYADIYTDASGPSNVRYMNCAGADQDYAINLSRATTSTQSNEWVFRFSPKSEILGIDRVGEDAETPAAGIRKGIYDFYGRKVENPGHGLYIVDGRKVVL